MSKGQTYRRERTEPERIQRGNLAKQKLDDPAFQEVRDTLQERFFLEWKTADTVDKREHLHARLKALDDILHEMENMVTDGTSAHRATLKREG